MSRVVYDEPLGMERTADSEQAGGNSINHYDTWRLDEFEELHCEAVSSLRKCVKGHGKRSLANVFSGALAC